MSGNYTPLFDSLTTGTLYGRWPDIGLWPIILSLTNRHGVVDVTPAYLAGVTGMDMTEISACMRRFCEPDPGSRSSENGGARLVLIDSEHRDWGWRVVNHAKYRERARLAAKNASDIATGRNRDRMDDRRAPPVTADEQRGPSPTAADRRSSPETIDDRLSYNSKQDKMEEVVPPAGQRSAPKTKEKRKSAKTRYPEDFVLSPDLEQYAVDNLPGVDTAQLLASFRGKAEAKGWEYANWQRAFQEFVRNAGPTSGHFAAGQYPRKAGSDITWR